MALITKLPASLLSMVHERASSPVTMTAYDVLGNAVVKVTVAFFGFPVNEVFAIAFDFVRSPKYGAKLADVANDDVVENEDVVEKDAVVLNEADNAPFDVVVNS